MRRVKKTPLRLGLPHAQMLNPGVLKNIGVGGVLVTEVEVTRLSPSSAPRIANEETPAIHVIVVTECQNLMPAENSLTLIGRPDSIRLNLFKRPVNVKTNSKIPSRSDHTLHVINGREAMIAAT